MHQIIAVEKDVRQTAQRRITDAYHEAQQSQRLIGFSRTYTPRQDGDQVLPPETKLVEVSVQSVLARSRAEFERLWDVVATKDFGNTTARADIILDDGGVIARDIPATYLLWLEKELNDLHTLISKLPVLDPSEQWDWSAEKNVFQTPAVETLRTKKEPRAFTLAPATDKHPAQVEMYHEDVPVGTWSTVKFSGALPATELKDLVDRVNELRNAVKQARARANETEVEQVEVAAPLLAFVLDGVRPTGAAAGA